jgi:nucleoside-diphosphate-sugar epimerase
MVTGAAGFIGSHLAAELVSRGWRVHGIDSFSAHYARELKELNLAELSKLDGFTFSEDDLAAGEFDQLIGDVQTVFHLAARPGVRDSWGEFSDYVRENVVATKALLDACVGRPVRLVFASSSSVYGNAASLPVTEDSALRPISPYGATKVMTETMVGAYAASHALDAVALRYFTVYGPRQRPDMALSRFIEATVAGQPITVYGDGRQMRDMTYVGDAVEATIAAAERGRPGAIYNIASGRPRRLVDLLDELATVMGVELQLSYEADRLGDVRDTWADVSRARKELAYRPMTSLREGLERQVEEAARRRERVPSASFP